MLLYFRSLKNIDISLQLLSKKLASLLALATGHRIQTLSLIEIDNIFVRSEKVEIRIIGRIKTSNLNNSQLILILSFIHNDPDICVAGVLL